MFKTAITTNDLVNDTANSFFRNIYGDPYNNDISFVSTLRALVAPRMSEDDQLSVRFQRTSYSARLAFNLHKKQERTDSYAFKDWNTRRFASDIIARFFE